MDGSPPLSPDRWIAGESAGLIFLMKPPGLPVFPPRAHLGEPVDGVSSMLQALLRLRPAQEACAWPPGFEGGIAHRLDNSTSGLLVVARDPESLAELRAAFAARAIEKTYLLVSGRQVPWDETVVCAPLGHDRRHRRRMVVRRGRSTPHRGRWLSAETAFNRLGDRRWEARIHTGVTHQVRLHAAFTGIPILGDTLYGGGPLPAHPDLPPGAGFLLHHREMVGAGWRSPAVAPPDWWSLVHGPGEVRADQEP